MKKIISALLVAVILSFCSIACCAESLLTYYNTVVIKMPQDISADFELPNQYQEKEASFDISFSLKDIIKGATNTFFQK